MRSYNIKLPRGVIVDIFNLPKNFETQIIESFKKYIANTEKKYRYRYKLEYIDFCVRYLNGDKYPDNVVNDLVENRIIYEWRESKKIIQEDDICCFKFMKNCYKKGKEDASLYSHFGSNDNYIYEQIQKVLVKVITIIMNYEE